MTEKTKPAPEKSNSDHKSEPATQPAETTTIAPTAPAAPTAMLVPEEGGGTTVKG